MKRYSAAPVLVFGLHAADGPLTKLRAEHPWLLASDADFARLHDLVASDPLAGTMYAKLQKQADAILMQQPVEHRLIGPRLLDQSRLCLEGVYSLAIVYRLGGDKRYLDRVVLERIPAGRLRRLEPLALSRRARDDPRARSRL
jgi:hypothetical protein